MARRGNSKVVRVEVTIAAPLDWVWWAWTRPERITAWFAAEANIEARPGGSFELFFDPKDHDHQCTKGCNFTLVDPMKRLGFTWKGPDEFANVMNDPASLTSATVTLEEENGKTRVVVEHGGWGKGEEWEKARSWHEMAWGQVLGSLKSALESGKAELCCAPEDGG
jgi:uncharacterized protein YndB with AHSA1/START domain